MRKYLPKTLPQYLALLMAVDGILMAVMGRGVLERIQQFLPPPTRQLAGFFRSWPASVFRLGALMQAAVGIGLFLTAKSDE